MREHGAIPLLTLWIAALWIAVGCLSKTSAGADARGERTYALPAAAAVVPKPAVPPSRSAPAPGATSRAAEEFDGVTAFGAAAVSLMLLCRSQQSKYPAFAPGTVVGAVLAGAYGFLQGAWPLGVALTAWAVVSAVRLWLRPASEPVRPAAAARARPAPGRPALPRWGDPSRRERMFGRP